MGQGKPQMKLVKNNFEISETIDMFSRRVVPPSVSRVVEKAKEFLTLNDNWDSYGARKTSPDAVVAAVRWASELFQEETPTPDVFPVPNGNVQIEWSCYDLEIEIEIESITKCSVFFEDLRSNESWEEEFSYDIRKLVAIISELNERHMIANQNKVQLRLIM